MSRHPYYERENYVNDIVFVDGVTRAGKFMLAHVIAGFERVEFMQYSFLMENLAYLVRLGKIDKATFKILCQSDIDYAAYNMMIGRGLNTRASDSSCIANSLEYDEYLARTREPDDSVLVKKFLDERRVPLFIFHELLCNISYVFDAFPRLKICHILRDPIALIESWYRRGWGRRWGTDPKSMAVVFGSAGGNIPWYVADDAELYNSLSEMDRVILCQRNIFRMMKESMTQLSPQQEKQICLLTFEDLVSNPKPTLNRISNFLQTTPHSRIEEVLTRERIPRANPLDQRDEKFEIIKKLASPEFVNVAENLASEYDKYWTGKAK